MSLEEMSAFFSSKDFSLSRGDRIFLSGDLGVGKTTLVRILLEPLTGGVIRSPTYTYYHVYTVSEKEGRIISCAAGIDTLTCYHFDLYRIENEETFGLIGGMEILENPDTICLIEWPDRLPKVYQPTKLITLSMSDDPTKRNITIEY